jgi:hypothetical protein
VWCPLVNPRSESVAQLGRYLLPAVRLYTGRVIGAIWVAYPVPVSQPGAMRTDSRQYGFLYWVKRAFLGALAAYLLLSGCPWSIFHPVSFLLTFMVHSMQPLGLASGPAAGVVQP